MDSAPNVALFRRIGEDTLGDGVVRTVNARLAKGQPALGVNELNDAVLAQVDRPIETPQVVRAQGPRERSDHPALRVT